MTLQHGNRIRKTSGKQVARELQVAEENEVFVGGPTEDEIRQHAHEIYLNRAGMQGNPMVDWLQAEIELRGHKAKARRSGVVNLV